MTLSQCIVGTEVWTNPDFEWSKRGWFANGQDFELDLKSNGPSFNPLTSTTLTSPRKKDINLLGDIDLPDIDLPVHF